MQNLYSIGMFALIFGFMYFFIIRPQNKRNKELKLLQDSLKEGDKVVTFSGLHGEIVEVGTAIVTVRIAPKTEVRIERAAIRSLVA